MNNELGRKLLELDELPDGEWNGYIRTLYYCSDKKKTFEEFKKDWEDFQSINKLESSIAYDKTFNIERGSAKAKITMFRQKGKEWHCSVSGMSGDYDISLEEAISLLGDCSNPKLPTTFLDNPRKDNLAIHNK